MFQRAARNNSASQWEDRIRASNGVKNFSPPVGHYSSACIVFERLMINNKMMGSNEGSGKADIERDKTALVHGDERAQQEYACLEDK